MVERADCRYWPSTPYQQLLTAPPPPNLPVNPTGITLDEGASRAALEGSKGVQALDAAGGGGGLLLAKQPTQAAEFLFVLTEFLEASGYLLQIPGGGQNCTEPREACPRCDCGSETPALPTRPAHESEQAWVVHDAAKKICHKSEASGRRGRQQRTQHCAES